MKIFAFSTNMSDGRVFRDTHRVQTRIFPHAVSYPHLRRNFLRVSPSAVWLEIPHAKKLIANKTNASGRRQSFADNESYDLQYARA